MSARKKARGRSASGRSTPASRRTWDRPDVASRIAWTYLATLIALVVAGIVLLIVNSLADSVWCQLPDENDALTCRLGWDILGAGLAFVLAFGAVVRPLKLDVWAWLALIALLTGWVALAMGPTWLSGWWSWAVLALVPAVAAALSAPWWPKPPGRVAHRVVLVALAVAGVTGAVFVYLAG